MAGTVDRRLDYAMSPGPRYAVLRCRGAGDDTTAQIWPRYRTEAGFDVDSDVTSLVNGQYAHVFLPFRRQWPLPPLGYAAAIECFEALRGGQSVALWGPGDSGIEETVRVVVAHLEHAGHSPIPIESEEELATARAANVPHPVFCMSSAQSSERSLGRLGPEVYFSQLAPSQLPITIRGFSYTVNLLENKDLTLEEALAQYPRINPDLVRPFHEQAAGAIGVLERLISGVSESDLATWLAQALATADLDILAAYRSVLDEHSPDLSGIEERRLVTSGVFRRDGTERNPLWLHPCGDRYEVTDTRPLEPPFATECEARLARTWFIETMPDVPTLCEPVYTQAPMAVWAARSATP